MAKNRQNAKEKASSKKAATSANRASTKSESDCCGCGKDK